MLYNNCNPQKSPHYFKGTEIKQIKNPLSALNQLLELASHVPDRKKKPAIKKEPSFFKDIKVLGYLGAILASFGLMGYGCSCAKKNIGPLQKNEIKINTQLKERIKE